MYCELCGKEISDYAVDCKRCGGAVKPDYAFLVEKAIENDRQAKEALYLFTSKSVYFVALKMTNNEQDAMDITHDSYMKAFDKLDTLQNPNQFSSWINRIAANLCKDYFKRIKPDFFEDLSTDGMEFQLEDESGELPSDFSVNQNIKEIVHDVINILPEEQRLCVMMYYFDEMTVGEISEVLGVSEGTVKSRLNYARKKMKTEIDRLSEQGVELRGIAVGLLFRNNLFAECETVNVPEGVLAELFGTGSAAISTAAGAKGISAAAKAIIAVVSSAVVVAGGVGAYLVLADNDNKIANDSSAAEVVMTDMPVTTTTTVDSIAETTAATTTKATSVTTDSTESKVDEPEVDKEQEQIDLLLKAYQEADKFINDMGQYYYVKNCCIADFDGDNDLELIMIYEVTSGFMYRLIEIDKNITKISETKSSLDTGSTSCGIAFNYSDNRAYIYSSRLWEGIYTLASIYPDYEQLFMSAGSAAYGDNTSQYEFSIKGNPCSEKECSNYIDQFEFIDLNNNCITVLLSDGTKKELDIPKNNVNVDNITAKDILHMTKGEYMELVGEDFHFKAIPGAQDISGYGVVGNDNLSNYSVSFDNSFWRNSDRSEEEDYELFNEIPDNNYAVAIGVSGNGYINKDVHMGMTYKELLTTIDCLGGINYTAGMVTGAYAFAYIDGESWTLIFEDKDSFLERMDDLTTEIEGRITGPDRYEIDATKENPKLIGAYRTFDGYLDYIYQNTLTATVKADGGLKLRNSPDKDNSQVMWTIPNGAQVKYLYNNGYGWVRVYYTTNSGVKKFGYVMSEYLDFDQE